MSLTVDEFVARFISSEIKSKGFVVSGNSFKKRDKLMTKVLTIERSQYNKGRFSMVLGVYFPIIADLLDGYWLQKPKTIRSYADCHMVASLDELTHRGPNKWLFIGPETDAVALAKSVLKNWNEVGERWLSGVTDLDTAIEHNHIEGGPTKIAFRVAAGRSGEAAEMVLASLEFDAALVGSGADTSRITSMVKMLRWATERCKLSLSIPERVVKVLGRPT